MVYSIGSPRGDQIYKFILPWTFDRYKRLEFEKPTIYILLCKNRNDALVELTLPKNKLIEKSQSQTDQSLLNRQSMIEKSNSKTQFNSVTPEILFNRLSFTHRDEDVFVSKYELTIPSKERMTEFLRKENEGLTRKEDKV